MIWRNLKKMLINFSNYARNTVLTDDILIGGDINEDISRNKSDNRAKYIQQLIQDCHLQVCSAGKTYVNPNGQACNEIDYFLYNRNTDRKFSDKIILDKLERNTSDHYHLQRQSRIQKYFYQDQE